MRLSCLLAVSLLAVVLSILGSSDCAHHQLDGSRSEVSQSDLDFSGDGMPKPKLEEPRHVDDIEQDLEGIAGNLEGAPEPNKADLKSMNEPGVLKKCRAYPHQNDENRVPPNGDRGVPRWLSTPGREKRKSHTKRYGAAMKERSEVFGWIRG